MKLAQTQAALQAHILAGDPAILDEVPSTPGFDATTRLAVYGNAYAARLSGVLHKDFPALAGLLGEAVEPVFSRYIAAHPSRSFTLRDFGAALPAFLAVETADTYPWAAALARFEWAFCEVFDAPDIQPLDVAALAALPPAAWASLAFVLHPATCRLATPYPVAALWRAGKAGESPPSLETGAETLSWLIWRDGERVCRYRHLERDEAAALTAVAEGEGFAEVCAALLPWHGPEAVAPRAASLLKTWLQAGWLSGLSFEGSVQQDG